jgi:hypothetical protein
MQSMRAYGGAESNATGLLSCKEQCERAPSSRWFEMVQGPGLVSKPQL